MISVTKLDSVQDAAYQAVWLTITDELGIPFDSWPGDKEVEYFCSCLRDFIAETAEGWDLTEEKKT